MARSDEGSLLKLETLILMTLKSLYLSPSFRERVPKIEFM